MGEHTDSATFYSHEKEGEEKFKCRCCGGTKYIKVMKVISRETWSAPHTNQYGWEEGGWVKNNTTEEEISFRCDTCSIVFIDLKKFNVAK